jgi:hypothetical protein
LQQFERLSHEHSREGSALLGKANKPGWMFAAGQGTAGNAAASSSETGTPSAAAGANEAAAAADEGREPGQAAAAATADAAAAAAMAAADTASSCASDRRGGLDQLLRRHVNTRLLHMISLHMLIVNTLTRVQLAHMLVGAAADCGAAGAASWLDTLI